jgi:hypothetical protein
MRAAGSRERLLETGKSTRNAQMETGQELGIVKNADCGEGGGNGDDLAGSGADEGEGAVVGRE